MTTNVTPPRLEYGDSQAGNVGVSRPRLSWTTITDAPNWRQDGVEISVTRGTRTEVAAIDGDASVLVDWPFSELLAREQGELRVRVRDQRGWSPWSEPTRFFAGFLGADQWRASFIGLGSPEREAQPFLARLEFDVAEGLAHATWYATAQGAYQAWFNGEAVDDQILKPGWTPYQHRLIHETTDVTERLTVGRNVIGVAVAGGWYTERFGFGERAAIVYGDQPSLAGQLLLEYSDGSKCWICTDRQWRVSGDSPWTEAGIYLGEDYDARRLPAGWDAPGLDDANWEQAAVHAPGVTPEPRTAPEVRVTQTVQVTKVLTSPSGKLLLDFGQNLVGRLRIRVSGKSGQTVTLRHAEVLENGELGVRPLRAARATDNYTLAGDGVEEYAPRFTFHGFRYAEVTGWPGQFDPADVRAEVISSDMRRTGWFKSSDDLLNRLHENVVWGMRSNFLYLPTDCPQRDERLGWTGDIQIFGPTAAFLYDCDGFLSSWLRDVWLEQRAADGAVAFVVPDVLNSGGIPAAAWGDVATVLPMVLFDRFGDRGTLEAQYQSMKDWTELILGLAGKRHLWEAGFQFGDWVDPDSPPQDPAKAKTDPDIVASAFLYRSTDLLAQAAAELGHAKDSARYAAEAEKVRHAWLDEYVSPGGRIVSDAQTAYALAIEFGIAIGELADQFGERLAQLSRREGYRISTGFVGTPLINDALTRTGHDAVAARMLLQTECPSWLYSVRMGATTIWERWDSLLEDGSINPGEMTSFNHYALGSVADWLHRVVAGLAPAAPGYRRIRIAPHALPGLDSASARHDGPYGRIEVSWQRSGDAVHVWASVPPNSVAVVELPGQDVFQIGSGRYAWEFTALQSQPRDLSPVTLESTLVDIMDDEEALEALLSALDAADPLIGEGFRKRTRWIPRQTLRGVFRVLPPTVVTKVMAELQEFNRGRAAGGSLCQQG